MHLVPGGVAPSGTAFRMIIYRLLCASRPTIIAAGLLRYIHGISPVYRGVTPALLRLDTNSTKHTCRFFHRFPQFLELFWQRLMHWRYSIAVATILFSLHKPQYSPYRTLGQSSHMD